MREKKGGWEGQNTVVRKDPSITTGGPLHLGFAPIWGKNELGKYYKNQIMKCNILQLSLHCAQSFFVVGKPFRINSEIARVFFSTLGF